MKTPEDFNPISDWQLAGVDVAQNEIDEAFKQNPWCKRLLVNKKLILRSEWRAEKKEVKK